MVQPVICGLGEESSEELAIIDAESNSPPWTAVQFSQEFIQSYSCIYGARLGGHLVGFLVGHKAADEVHIVNFATRNGWRSQGIGRALLSHALVELDGEGFRSVVLEVRLGNHAAQRLYCSMGFREVGIRQGYYSDNQEAALFMALDMQEFITALPRRFSVTRPAAAGPAARGRSSGGKIADAK